MNVGPEIQYILNTFSFLVCGVLVMWMAAGFAMLEAGAVRTKNVSTILLKNISLFSIAGIMYYVVGYNLMYTDVSGIMGSLGFWGPGTTEAYNAGEYAPASDWFFQMVFVATAASIVSGTVAERIKLVPFLLFVVVLTGLIYPIYGAWTWGGGWLSEMGFADFAGSTIVHSVGGWAALIGAMLIGPRIGKYNQVEGKWRMNPMPASSLPLVTLGTFVLWMGWFGFNGGSVLALGTGADATAMANVFVNTTLAAAGGCVAVLLLTTTTFKKTDLTLVLNGTLAGLVAITAGPDTPTPGQAIFIGAVGGIICAYGIMLLQHPRVRIDDVVGAVPVHLLAGIWGTMIVPWTNADASYMTQFVGIAACGALVAGASLVVWGVLRTTIGIRADGQVEDLGLDQHELGVDAYPEFRDARITDYKQSVV